MSGHLFDDVEPVSRADWSSIRSNVCDELYAAGVFEIRPIGSTEIASLMGDIDLAVSCPGGRDHVFETLQKRFQTRKTGNDLVAFRYPLSSKRWVQIDVMVGNPTWLAWARAGSIIPGVKNSCRAVLLNTITRVYSQLHLLNEFVGAGLDRKRYVIDFGGGLYLVDQTKRGKTKLLTSWKTSKKEYVTDDPEKVVNMLFGPHTTAFKTEQLPWMVEALRKSTYYVDASLIEHMIINPTRVELQSLAAKNPSVYGDIEKIDQILNS